MKKSFITLVAASAILATSCTVFADEKDDRIKELETQIEEMQNTIDDLKVQLEKYTESSDMEVYGIGDTWVVAGQWGLTIDSVEKIDDRNEFSDVDPAAVYTITYSYENLGYEDTSGFMNGLYIDLSGGIVDADKKMGYSYPGDITMYPQETPVGSKCEAQACIGVDNPGNFEIHVSIYDSENKEQEATFLVAVD